MQYEAAPFSSHPLPSLRFARAQKPVIVRRARDFLDGDAVRDLGVAVEVRCQGEKYPGEERAESRVDEIAQD